MRIIIEHPSDISGSDALTAVKRVMALGRCSASQGVRKYCHVSNWQGLTIVARDRRTKDSADSFLVTRTIE